MAIYPATCLQGKLETSSEFFRGSIWCDGVARNCIAWYKPLLIIYLLCSLNTLSEELWQILKRQSQFELSVENPQCLMLFFCRAVSFLPFACTSLLWEKRARRDSFTSTAHQRALPLLSLSITAISTCELPVFIFLFQIWVWFLLAVYLLISTAKFAQLSLSSA